MNHLTNDAKFLLTALYKEYVSRRTDKMPKYKAVMFIDEDYIHHNLMPEWSLDDVSFTCDELVRNDLLSGRYLSNKLQHIQLTTYAISMLEESFSDKLDKVIDFMAKIKSAIPFI